jgi:hypothetical protein
MPLLTAYLQDCGIQREHKRLNKQIDGLMKNLKDAFMENKEIASGKRSVEDTVNFLKSTKFSK